jgi:hypothetical protein
MRNRVADLLKTVRVPSRLIQMRRKIWQEVEISEHQMSQALRVASVAEEDLEWLIESNPTLKALVRLGTKQRPKRQPKRQRAEFMGVAISWPTAMPDRELVIVIQRIVGEIERKIGTSR